MTLTSTKRSRGSVGHHLPNRLHGPASIASLSTAAVAVDCGVPHPLDAYFGAAPTADQLVPVDAYTRGAVTRTETLWREAPVAGGFFDPAIFGPLDGSSPTWGHIDIAAGISIAGTRVTRIPVPPIAQRLPRVVDDPLARTLWHQRINEAWLALLHASRMHDRFVSLGGPSQAAHVQQHFEDIVAVMRGEEPASHHGDHAPGDHAHGDRRHVSRDDVYTMMPCPPSEPARPLALLLLDDGRLLVQSTVACRVMTRATGASLAPDIAWVASDLAWTPTGPRASSVHGELVVFNGGQRDVWRRGSYPEGLAWPEDALRSAPLAAYDLRARAWVMLVDERFPAWVVDETDVAGADAHELATGQTHDLVAGSQRAAQLAQTRDGRFVLARVARLAMFDDATDAADEDDADEDDADEDDADEDDADVFGVPSDDDARDYVLSIIEIATQRPFVIATDAPAILSVVVLGAPTTTRPAVCASNDGWRIVDPSGAVGDGERWWYRLEGASLVAWSPRGDQLAAIVGDEIVILDLAPTGATIASRAPLGGASS